MVDILFLFQLFGLLRFLFLVGAGDELLQTAHLVRVNALVLLIHVVGIVVGTAVQILNKGGQRAVIFLRCILFFRQGFGGEGNDLGTSAGDREKFRAVVEGFFRFFRILGGESILRRGLIPGNFGGGIALRGEFFLLRLVFRFEIDTGECDDVAFGYTDGSKVLIAPATPASITIDETVTPEAVVVNSDSLVTISGSGAIAGTGSVNKAGAGKLVLGTANTYTGATVLYGGTIEFSTLKDAAVPSSIGASEEFAQNWIWSGGTWLYTGGSTSTNRSAKIYEPTEFNIAKTGNTVTMNGSLEGDGDFILNGKGQLTVGTTNFFKHTGKTILKGSTLYLSTIDIAKAGIGSSSKLVMAGGTLKTKGDNNNYETYAFPIEVQEGTTSYFVPHRNCYITSKVTGSGTIQIDIPYLREYIKGDWGSFTGRIIANGVNTKASEGSLFLLNGNGNDFPKATVELKGCAHLAGWTTNCDFEIGGISGDKGTYIRGSSKNTSGFTCSYTVGGANTDETFNGVINNLSSSSTREGTVSIKKVGSGDWRLTGANVYKGSTTVSGGRLIINGSHTGTGAITVNNGATLCGKGKVAGKVTVNAGGTVAVGDTVFNRSDVFTMTNGATIKAGGIVQVPLSRTASLNRASKIKFGGITKITDAILQLDMTDVIADLVVNSSFTIFDVSSATYYR